VSPDIDKPSANITQTDEDLVFELRRIKIRQTLAICAVFFALSGFFFALGIADKYYDAHALFAGAWLPLALGATGVAGSSLIKLYQLCP
jgi:Na+/glutamate symporter